MAAHFSAAITAVMEDFIRFSSSESVPPGGPRGRTAFALVVFVAAVRSHADHVRATQVCPDQFVDAREGLD